MAHLLKHKDKDSNHSHHSHSHSHSHSSLIPSTLLSFDLPSSMSPSPSSSPSPSPSPSPSLINPSIQNNNLDRYPLLATSSVLPSSLPPEDYYGFISSAESDESNSLLDLNHNLFHSNNLPSRSLKKRKNSPFPSSSSPSSYISFNKPDSDSDDQPPCPSSSTLTPPILPSISQLDLPSSSDPEFFHSHHLRTSAHLRNFPSPTTLSHHPPATQPDSLALALDPPCAPRAWFSSSRRQKRKHSFHALSATSTSSSASLSPDSSIPKNKLDGSPKYPPGSRRTSSARLRRWSRSLPGLGPPSLLSLRWLRKSLSPRQPLGILAGLLLFIVFAVSLTTFLIKFLDTDSTPLPWRSFCQDQREFPHALADSLEPVNVFVGVFSVDSAYERRHLIRSTYARHSRPVDPQTGQPGSNVQLRFVLGRPRLQHVRRVALEMETYNDIVVLDIQENMNRGKTYAFMRWASENATVPIFYHPFYEPKPKTGVNGIGGVLGPQAQGKVELGVGFKKADFVVKADDDAFIVLSELERHLRVAPREKTYWGYLIRNLFMGGECYALSADLVNYVATSERVAQYLTGAEDKKVAKWMRIHPNATTINWVTERCWVYDHPKAGTTYSHGFLFPDEVARVRAEGRRGLTAEEVEMRGTEHGQAFSTVTKWKERYVAPKSALTMEEEVEALVEGGGRYSETGYRRPVTADPPVPVDRLVFEPIDPRLARSALLGATGAAKRAPAPHEHTPPVRSHYEEPALKFGRPPSELMAHLPHVDDLPASKLKETIQAGLDAQGESQKMTDGASKSESSRRVREEPVFVPAPTLRFDEEDLRIRAKRFLGRAHGGTVVVHYLKRSEWFLETSLALLGRSKTWDDGIVPGLYRQVGYGLSGALVESSSGTSGATSGSGSRSGLEESQMTSSLDKQVEVKKSLDWPKKKKKNQSSNRQDTGAEEEGEDLLEVVSGGPSLFGEPRRYGSVIIGSDGNIREGRGGMSSSRWGDEKDGKDRVNVGVGDKEGGGGQEDEKEVDEIRKSQFGGAGWVRGKPRVRVVDQNDELKIGSGGLKGSGDGGDGVGAGSGAGGVSQGRGGEGGKGEGEEGGGKGEGQGIGKGEGQGGGQGEGEGQAQAQGVSKGEGEGQAQAQGVSKGEGEGGGREDKDKNKEVEKIGLNGGGVNVKGGGLVEGSESRIESGGDGGGGSENGGGGGSGSERE